LPPPPPPPPPPTTRRSIRPPLKKVTFVSPVILYIAIPGMDNKSGVTPTISATIAGDVDGLRATEFDLTKFFIELERTVVTVIT
jgi:hypothetical protein